MGLIAAVLSVSVPLEAEGRLLNLNGEIGVNFNGVWGDSEGNDADSSTWQETVLISNRGELLREALGRYSLSFRFLNEDRSVDIDTGQASGSVDENRQAYDYFLSVDLLPRAMPLSITAQRVTSLLESGGADSKTTVTTVNLTWVLPRIWKLPELRANLFYSVFETDTDEDRIFGGSVSATDQYASRYIIKNTELRGTLSFYSVQRVEGEGTDLSIGGTVTADTQWTPALTSNARVSYTTGISVQTPNVPGGVATATAVGLALHYRPSLRFTTSGGYDYTKDIVNRHIGTAQFLYRPTPRFDINGTARAILLDLGKNDILTTFGSALITFRPMLNLTTSLSAIAGANQTFGLDACTPPPVPPAPQTCLNLDQAIFHNYGLAATYFKVMELAQITTSGAVNYGGNITLGDRATRQPDSSVVTRDLAEHSNNVSSSWSVQATNTKTQYVTVTGAYSGYYNVQSEGANNEQWTNTVRLDASSSYFRELLLRGDHLSLHVGIFDTITNTSTDSNQDLGIATDAGYGWQWLEVGTGYAMHFSTGGGTGSKSYFGELRVVPPIRVPRFTSNAGVRYEEQMFENQFDRSFLRGDINLGWQVGRVMLSVQYQYYYQQETGASQVHNLFARLSRYFSL
ncbi:MAG: hypothetical protein AB1515_05905 [Nitrospirota bacterium]